MTLSATDPTDRVEQLTALTERLSERLAGELKAFEANRPQDAALTLAETQKLANLYRHESARVKANPALVTAAPHPLKLKLIEATRTFDAILARHAIAVEASKILTEGLVKTIASEIAAQRKPAAGYGPGAHAWTGDTTALTLNRRA